MCELQNFGGFYRVWYLCVYSYKFTSLLCVYSLLYCLQKGWLFIIICCFFSSLHFCGLYRVYHLINIKLLSPPPPPLRQCMLHFFQPSSNCVSLFCIVALPLYTLQVCACSRCFLSPARELLLSLPLPHPFYLWSSALIERLDQNGRPGSDEMKWNEWKRNEKPARRFCFSSCMMDAHFCSLLTNFHPNKKYFEWDRDKSNKILKIVFAFSILATVPLHH